LPPRQSVALKAVTQVTQAMRVTRLESIRSRILALAVLGTLLPAGITLGVAYLQNRRALETKINADLISSSTQAARVASVWLKEQVYVLRVFAGSEEVMGNLGRYATQGLMSPRLREYLRSLHERYPDFEQLMVLDARGQVLATSARQVGTVNLPEEWQKTLRQRGRVVAPAYWDEKTGMRKAIVAVPVMRADGQLMGAFAADANLAPLSQLLRDFAPDSVRGGAYLMSDSGVVVTSAYAMERGVETMLLRETHRDLLDADSATASFATFDGRDVVGTLEPVADAPWAVLAEVTTESAFEQVRRFRSFALAVVVLLLLIVGVIAHRLGILIVRPLERLAQSASQVGIGGFDVPLPTDSAGEVGALTRVFNDMVAQVQSSRQELADANARLSEKNTELEKLSVTDGLTGLMNHRALMQRLVEEGDRSQRNNRPFVVIMADVDHFKQYNDTFGHPEGDVVLKKVASVLKDCTRTIDCVARYGGEEFAGILPDTDMSGGMEVAERMRARVEATEFPGRRVTISVGVAVFPKDAPTPKDVIAVADSALYIAKREGRNQVAQARQAAKTQKLPSARKSTAGKAVADKVEKAPARAPRASTAKPAVKGKKKS
jgi:diguanylate cyclase (GGDEF)-like protein